MLEHCIANGQRLVDYQNVRLYARGDGERQSHVHAAGISFYRLIKKLPNLCEPFDLWKQRICSAPRESQQRGIHVNVFNAGELRVKAGSQFQQRGDAAFVPHIAMGRLQCARDNLQ